MKLQQTICFFFFSYSAKSFFFHSTSYYIWSFDKLFASIFPPIEQKVCLSLNFIYNIELQQTICFFFFSYSAKSFTFHLTSCYIWNEDHLFAYSFYYIQRFRFSYINLLIFLRFLFWDIIFDKVISFSNFILSIRI